MTTNPAFSQQLEILRQFNLQIRLQLEQAEAKLPALNSQIDQLSRTGFLEGEAVLGDVICSRGYHNQPERSSGLVVQAAALVPGGIGVVDWDTEDFRVVSESPGPSFSEARIRFRAFDQLEPALRAMLLPHVEPILNQLLAKAFPALPKSALPVSG